MLVEERTKDVRRNFIALVRLAMSVAAGHRNLAMQAKM